MDKLEAALIGALLLIVPPATMLIVAKLRLMKADIDSAFAKIRAHEDELGIKTIQMDSKTKEQKIVSSIPPRPLDPNDDPQGNGEGQGPSGAA